MNILIFGDSITWGAYDKQGGWAQRIKSVVDSKILSETPDYYTSVYCLGVSGDNTTDLLDRFDNEIIARFDEDQETLILIAIGTNDTQVLLESNTNRMSLEKYRQNILQLIEKSNKYSARLIFIGLIPVDNRVDPVPWSPEKAYRNHFIQLYNDTLRELCADNRVEYIEVADKFPETRLNELLYDGLHPSSVGHEIIASKIINYLQSKNLL